jgi:hypothetical protein
MHLLPSYTVFATLLTVLMFNKDDKTLHGLELACANRKRCALASPQPPLVLEHSWVFWKMVVAQSISERRMTEIE